jgi:hypothetical protein
MLMEAVRIAGGTDKDKVVAALNQIKGLALANGTANFSPMNRLLVRQQDLGMFEYIKGEKTPVELSISKQ